MRLFSLIKQLAALLILCCFFLPLSQCSQVAATTPPSPAPTAPSTFVAAERVDPREPSSDILLAVLLWPACARLLAARRLRILARPAVMQVVEIALSAASLSYMGVVIAYSGTIRVGGIALLTGYLAYLLVTGAELAAAQSPSATGYKPPATR